MKEAVKNGTEKNIKRLRTYFGNNLTVIKDNGLFKVLFKLVSLQMKEYNKAVKHNLSTDNITFQYSLNEFRLDLQMGKTTILKKLDILTNTGLLSVEKCKDEKNSYCKNTYQLNIEKLDSIIDTLNGMRRKERIEYINNIFNTKTSKDLTTIKDEKIEEDVEPITDGMLDTTNNDMKEMVKVMLGKQQEPKPSPIVLGTENEINNRIESFTTSKDEVDNVEVRQLFIENGDEWLLDKWLASDKSPEEIKLLIQSRIESYNTVDEVEEVSLFDDDYLIKLYPNKKFIKTEFGTYEEVIEGMEEYIEQIIEEERYIA